MMRRQNVLVTLGILALVWAAAFGQPESTAGRDKVAPTVGPRAALTHPIPKLSLVKVGFHNLGGSGFNGDVWLHGSFAYVGSWGIGGDCPGTGVKVVDISNPLVPTLVDVL